MPGQTGTDSRRRTNVRTNRWDDNELTELRAIAKYSGCSEAEALRRLVRRANKNIVISRDLVIAVNTLGIAINQLIARVHESQPFEVEDLQAVYRELLALVKVARL